jgi:hypothetical protein
MIYSAVRNWNPEDRKLDKSQSNLCVFSISGVFCYVYFIGKLVNAPDAVADTLPTPAEPEGATALSESDGEEDLTSRLEALKS